MAKERYRKISVRMWNDREFMSLSNDAKLIWVYILTCPAMLPFGAMRATLAGMAEELGMEPKGFREGFQELLAKGLVKHCPKALCLVVPKFIQHNMPENPNVITSWRESIHMAPECDLLDSHMYLVSQQVKGLPEPFMKAFAKAFPIPFGKGMPIQEQEQEQEQEQYNTPLPPSKGGSAEVESPKQECLPLEAEAKEPTIPFLQSLPIPTPHSAPPPSPPFDAIVAAWNGMAKTNGLPRITELSRKRHQLISTRWKEKGFRQHWNEVIDAIPTSEWHCGKNDRGWKADFDWFLRPDTVIKFYERMEATGVKGGDFTSDDGIAAGLKQQFGIAQ